MTRKANKKKKSTSKSVAKRSGSDMGSSRFGHVARRGLLWLIGIAAIGVGGAAAFSAMQRVVLEHRAGQGPVPYTVEFTRVPHWMPHELARHLSESLTPEMHFSDENLCAEVHRRARQNPWIETAGGAERYRIDDGRRGVVRVEATFRQPAAAVRHNGQTGFVDAGGVVLPFEQVPRYGVRDENGRVTYHVSTRTVPRGQRPRRIHYLLIDGVAMPRPREGKVWLGDDVQAGLQLTALLKTRPYVNQVTVIDVRNHGRRVSDTLSEIVFYAQSQYDGRQSDITRILWGRFPHPDGDWVIRPERKMQYLDRYVDRHDGKLAGFDRALDLRHDNLILP